MKKTLSIFVLLLAFMGTAQTFPYSSNAVSRQDPSPSPTPIGPPVTICAPNQVIGFPPTCVCLTKEIGNPPRCKPDRD